MSYIKYLLFPKLCAIKCFYPTPDTTCRISLLWECKDPKKEKILDPKCRFLTSNPLLLPALNNRPCKTNYDKHLQLLIFIFHHQHCYSASKVQQIDFLKKNQQWNILYLTFHIFEWTSEKKWCQDNLSVRKK